MKIIALTLMGILSAATAAPIDLSTASIVVVNPQKRIAMNAAAMLRDEIEKRTRMGLVVVPQMPSSDATVILVGTAEELAGKGYRPPAGYEVPTRVDACALWIDSAQRRAPTVCVAGYDDRGTLYAVGRLLRVLEMSRDQLRLDSGVKLATAPRTALRGHQLGYRPKSNSYDAWTLAMWEQYYRDMIVFGMNAVELVPPRSDDAPDSPHFPKPPMEMMVKMSQLADDYGLDVWLWFPAIGNAGSDWKIIHTDYADKKTVDAAIEEWGEVFRKLPRIDAVFVPGGDPGDGMTHPAVLLPFMEKQKKNLNKYHPKARMWVSPQCFHDFQGFMPAFLGIMQKEQPAWLDGVVFGPQVEMKIPLSDLSKESPPKLDKVMASLQALRKEIPAHYPIRNYPDITHSGGGQYKLKNWDVALNKTLGREPINPRPLGYAKSFRDLYQYSIGFITYSEGCNDDFNKVLWSCLGWDPDMDVKAIALEYSRFFISERYQEKFAEGLFGLERNWVGPVKDNDGIYETLKIFQEMEKDATPQDKLNWRFQQGLYRAYYDAYVKARLQYETDLETQAVEVLKKAKEIGALKATDEAEAIIEKGVTEKTRAEWRARTFELAEALYQSIRMQLSVEKYQAISVSRGANLDRIDAPLNQTGDLKKSFGEIRQLSSEADRLAAIKKLTTSQ